MLKSYQNKRMNLSVPTDFSDEHLNGILRINKEPEAIYPVGELYGAMPFSPIGNLRPGLSLPNIGLDNLSKHIEKLNNFGLKFNYTLNSLWTNKMENNQSGLDKVLYFLKELDGAGVRRTTISLPWLVRFAHKNMPHWEITASIAAKVNNLQTLRQFKEYGASRVVLDRDVNRKVSFIKNACSTDMGITLLGTTPCILGCAEVNWHGLWSSIDSTCNTRGEPNVTVLEKPPMNCYAYLLNHPSEFLKIPWIRPEDLHLYDDLGVDTIKLDGRDRPLEYNLEKTRAFALGSFEGNLLYLLYNKFPHDRRAFLMGEGKYRFFIDNKSLDGFLPAFFDKLECEDNCDSCRHCINYSEKFLEFDEKWRLSEIKKIVESS
ncbi:MAG: U32 family peptidase [archaeon]